jgi:VanZ family protein
VLADRYGNLLIAANALILMLASWTPGRFMMRSGIFSGHVEHALAYALSGVLIYVVAARRFAAGRFAAWRAAALLSAYAGVLELGQIFVPGRHAGIDDFLSSATGAAAGVLAAAALLKRAHPGGQ